MSNYKLFIKSKSHHSVEEANMLKQPVRLHIQEQADRSTWDVWNLQKQTRHVHIWCWHC